MAWEWVAPVATATTGCVGVFFTWLGSHQSRQQAALLARQQESRADELRIVNERRNAYINALEFARQELKRVQYEQRADKGPLRRLEETWPSEDRFQRALQIRIAIETFGSEAAQDNLREWDRLIDRKDLSILEGFYVRLVRVARLELGTVALDAGAMRNQVPSSGETSGPKSRTSGTA